MSDDVLDEVMPLASDEPLILSQEPRQQCAECERPVTTCWCQALPDPLISLSPKIARVIIFQHPKESRRPHQTAKMAAMGLANRKCQIHTRTKIKPDDPVLAEASASSSVYVMFPNPKSTDVKELAMAQLKQPVTIILLDGTWDEAKKLLERSPVLHQFPSLHLDLLSNAGGCWEKSAFVIKTQPNPQCMSTVETVAHTLAVLEGDQSIVTRMIHPLNTLCQIQLNHGAVTHDDKVTKKQLSH